MNSSHVQNFCSFDRQGMNRLSFISAGWHSTMVYNFGIKLVSKGHFWRRKIILLIFNWTSKRSVILHSRHLMRKVSLDLLAVQTAKTICRESKNRNIMRRDIEAPIGKNIAWHVSIVCIPTIKIFVFWFLKYFYILLLAYRFRGHSHILCTYSVINCSSSVSLCFLFVSPNRFAYFAMIFEFI